MDAEGCFGILIAVVLVGVACGFLVRAFCWAAGICTVLPL